MHISGNTGRKQWEFPISKTNPVNVAKNDDWRFVSDKNQPNNCSKGWF